MYYYTIYAYNIHTGEIIMQQRAYLKEHTLRQVIGYFKNRIGCYAIIDKQERNGWHFVAENGWHDLSIEHLNAVIRRQGLVKFN